MGIKNAQRLFHHRKTFGRWQIKNLRKKRRKIIYICAHLKMKNVLKFQLSFCLRCQWQKKEKTRRHAGVFLFRYHWLINEIEGSQLFCGRTRTKRVHVKKKNEDEDTMNLLSVITVNLYRLSHVVLCHSLWTRSSRFFYFYF